MTATCIFNNSSDLKAGRAYHVIKERPHDVLIGPLWYFKDRFIEYRNFKVKPLVWRQEENFRFVTDTVFGRVKVFVCKYRWRVTFANQYFVCDSVEDGQQIATEWYFGKLLEALEPV